MNLEPVFLTQGERMQLEKIHRLVNEAMFTISLQCRRIMSGEPEDSYFILRRHVDIYFLIFTLSKLRDSIKKLSSIAVIKQEIESSIGVYDTSLPEIKNLRNVIMHMDGYLLEKGNNKSIEHRKVQVDFWDVNNFG